MYKASVHTLHTHSLALPALVLLFALAALLITPSITTFVLLRAGLVRPNYRGDHIPAMFGLSIIVSSLVLFGIAVGRIPNVHDSVLQWIALVLCFGALGFVDDRWGDTQIKGLKGHLRAAVKDHLITSGLVKAVGGVAGGLLIGRWLYPANSINAIMAGLIIALSANGMNLFDLRPGRACAVFLLGSTALLAAAVSTPLPPTGELLLACVVLPALPAWILDSRAKVMLGDTGSNVLGASLGLAVVESHSVILAAVVLALLIALHIVAERRSITQIIANNRILNTLDKLTGLRE